MRIAHREGRDAFVATTHGFLEAVQALDDGSLLNASRCHGWCLVDVVVHVQLGLAEVGRGLLGVRADGREPDCDASSYWRTPPPGTGDTVAATLYVRRLGAAFRLPSLATRQLRDTAGPVLAATATLPPGTLDFQGHVLSTGDFLASWAVELAVHQLDLGRETDVPAPHPSGLSLARRTAEALFGTVLPGDDETAVLLGTGRRRPTPDEASALGPAADRLPVLG